MRGPPLLGAMRVSIGGHRGGLTEVGKKTRSEAHAEAGDPSSAWLGPGTRQAICSTTNRASGTDSHPNHSVERPLRRLIPSDHPS